MTSRLAAALLGLTLCLLSAPTQAQEVEDETLVDEEGNFYDWQGMPLTHQDEDDFPSRAIARFDFARILDKDPRLDGVANEEVWEAVPDHMIPLAKVNGGSFDSPSRWLHLKGFHNGRILYLLAWWDDDTYDDTLPQWEWNSATHRYAPIEAREDGLTFLIRTYGDFHGDGGRGYGFAADEWHWGAALTNATGYALDGWRLQLRGAEKGMPMEKLTDRDGKPYFRNAPLDSGAPCFRMLPAPTGFAGDRIPRAEWREPEYSAGNVRARGQYGERVWTLEIARHLETHEEDDLQFQTLRRYDTSFTVHDAEDGGLFTSQVYSIRLLE